jgi:hypothetical protein
MYPRGKHNYLQASRRLRWTINAIVAYFAVVAVALLYGFLRRDAFILFLVLMPLAPLGLIMTTAYRGIRAAMIRRKTQELADILEEASSKLEEFPPRITEFDILLSVDTAFVWRGVVTPFLIATARLMDHTANMLMSEELGRNKSWTSNDELSPVRQMASHLRLMATAVRENDHVRTFEAIGDLMALSVNLRRDNEELRIVEVFGEKDFIQACNDIAILLKRRRFFDADSEIKRLLLNISRKDSTASAKFRWQVLISYWLWIRLSFLEIPLYPEPTRFWVGPSRLLAVQLEAVVAAYSERDYAGLTEIVYESFDWRTRVPRFLL